MRRQARPLEFLQQQHAIETLEEKVEGMEAEITNLHLQLGESREVCQALAEALRVNNSADLRREMEAISIQIGLLQRAVSNGPVVAPEPVARLWIPEPATYSGAR
ncbi:hypothetical protein Pfo_006879, partial [Paulownia fortunei]